VRWQWAYSAFGETPPQALAHVGQPLVDAYSLRYPGQVDDGNGLFYNFNRSYHAKSGRYTQADPIGLEGGWNRFGYAGRIHSVSLTPLAIKPQVWGVCVAYQAGRAPFVGPCLLLHHQFVATDVPPRI
jgi:RHS repeat-associated protein